MDGHDVDEDLRTIVYHGGEWYAGSWAGVTYRFVTAISAIRDSSDAVASLKNKNSLSQ